MKKLSVKFRRNLTLAGLFLCGFFLYAFIASPQNLSYQAPSEYANSGEELFQKNFSRSTLAINEVCAENFGFYVESIRIFADYIELVNTGKEPLSLKGLYLSDTCENLFLAPLPEELVLDPGSFVLIYGEEDPAKLPASCYSVDFQLKPGETLFLSDKNGILDSVTIPRLLPGTSYSRREDGTGAFTQLWMSPGLSNQGAGYPLDAPVLSLESGFYPEAVSLTLSSPQGASVYYTLDGSLPDTSSLRYQAPLLLSDASAQENTLCLNTDISGMQYPYEPPTEPLDKAVVVRARAMDPEGNYSPTVTGVYFIGFQEKESYENIPVLSLVADPEALFDPDRGIYVMGSLYQEGLAAGEVSPDYPWAELMPYTNYGQKGCLYERNAHFDYFSPDQELLFSQEGGMRIRGNQSRNFPQKSFSLYSRERYGSSSFAPVFFESGASYSALTLNGSYQLAKVLIGPLVADRSVATQKYQPCQVFLNGEYWGLYYLMEKYDAAYAEHYFHVDAKDLLLIESTYTVANGDPEDLRLFKSLRNLLEEDMSNPLYYQEAESQLDMQSLIDWLCTNIYVANTDTKPLGGNVFTWKSTESGPLLWQDGRWRWMLYDTDNSFGAGMEISAERPAWAIDSFVDHPAYSPAGFLDSPPMNTLMANEDFRRRFVITFQDMANENFRPETVLTSMDLQLENFSKYAAKSNERWNASHTLDSSAYQEEANSIRDFFLHRFDAIMPCLAQHFSLEGPLVSLTLSLDQPDAGSLTLNTITPDMGDGSWIGRYYTDYPLSLTACPADGYQFAAWEIHGGTLLSGSLTSSSITLRLEDPGTEIKASFTKTEE